MLVFLPYYLGSDQYIFLKQTLRLLKGVDRISKKSRAYNLLVFPRLQDYMTHNRQKEFQLNASGDIFNYHLSANDDLLENYLDISISDSQRKLHFKRSSGHPSSTSTAQKKVAEVKPQSDWYAWVASMNSVASGISGTTNMYRSKL